MSVQHSAQVYRIMRDDLLRRYPELENDEQILMDTLEGCTDVQEQIAELIRSAVLDEAKVEGIKLYQQKLSDRKVALFMRAERKRKLALHYMDDLNLKRIVAPDLTVSRRSVAPSAVITDESLIPEQFLRWKSEIDRPAVKAALKNGESVPGAHMNNGGETLAIKI